MNPILLSTTVFIALEAAHHFNPAFAFGLAVGGGLMCLLNLAQADPAPQTASHSQGDKQEGRDGGEGS